MKIMKGKKGKFLEEKGGKMLFVDFVYCCVKVVKLVDRLVKVGKIGF